MNLDDKKIITAREMNHRFTLDPEQIDKYPNCECDKLKEKCKAIESYVGEVQITNKKLSRALNEIKESHETPKSMRKLRRPTSMIIKECGK